MKVKSLLGFKHSEETRKFLRSRRIGKPYLVKDKLKLYSNIKAFELKIIDIVIEEVIYLPSIRRTSIYIYVHSSYISKCLSKKGYCKVKNYYMVKNLIKG